MCLCSGLGPRTQQDGAAGLGSELVKGMELGRAAEDPSFFPPPLFLLLLSTAVGPTVPSSVWVLGLIPALVGTGDKEGTWTSLSLHR